MSDLFDRLPTFFILGAAKAGTTTLYDLLKAHQQVFLPFDKEPMFFSRDAYYQRGLDWYSRTYFSASQAFPARGEATPHYLYWANHVSSRLKEVYFHQSPRFIIILRNPIERAYSWYWNMVIDGREDLPFLEALRQEEQRLSQHSDSLAALGSMQYGYLRGSQYTDQIRRFYQDFSPSHFHFLLLDDLLSTPGPAIQALLDFLGLQQVKIPLPTANQASRPRNKFIHSLIRDPLPLKERLKPLLPARLRHALRAVLLRVNLREETYPEMEPAARTYLLNKLTPQVHDLSHLLSRDLSHWLEDAP